MKLKKFCLLKYSNYCLHPHCYIHNVLSFGVFGLLSSPSLLYSQRLIIWSIRTIVFTLIVIFATSYHLEYSNYCLHPHCYIHNVLSFGVFRLLSSPSLLYSQRLIIWSIRTIVFTLIVIFTTSYHLEYSNYCLHPHCYIHNVLSFGVFGLLSSPSLLYSQRLIIWSIQTIVFTLIVIFTMSYHLEYSDYCLHLHCYIHNVLSFGVYKLLSSPSLLYSQRLIIWSIRTIVFTLIVIFTTSYHLEYSNYCLHPHCYIHNVLSFGVFKLLSSPSLLYSQRLIIWSIQTIVFTLIVIFTTSYHLEYSDYCLHPHCYIHNVLSFGVFGLLSSPSLLYSQRLIIWSIQTIVFTLIVIFTTSYHLEYSDYCLHPHCYIHNVLSFGVFKLLSSPSLLYSQRLIIWSIRTIVFTLIVIFTTSYHFEYSDYCLHPHCYIHNVLSFGVFGLLSSPSLLYSQRLIIWSIRTIVFTLIVIFTTSYHLEYSDYCLHPHCYIHNVLSFGVFGLLSSPSLLYSQRLIIWSIRTIVFTLIVIFTMSYHLEYSNYCLHPHCYIHNVLSFGVFKLLSSPSLLYSQRLIIWSIRTIVFIFVVIFTILQSMQPLALFRCLMSNLTGYMIQWI